MGFGSNKDAIDILDVENDNLLSYVTAQDLKSFGLIPELIGRLPVLTFLNPLDESTLRNILTKPKNALIKQYSKLFEMEDVKIEFKAGAIDFIVEKAVEYKLGARGLRSICEAIVNDAMFEIPSQENIDKLIINRSYAEEKFSNSKYSKLKVA
ncbi:MAG: ATP-dependent Clp protease ATP-binding subunit ClpX, partial [Bacteroidota bacterium]